MEQQVSPIETAPGGLKAWRSALSAPWALGLAGLLGVQILIALGLAFSGGGALTPAALDKPLLDFDAKSVTAVRIESGQAADSAGSGDATVTLARTDQGWAVAELADFPADGAKVDRLIETLAGLKRPLPIATSDAALTRHKVSDKGFERKVTLESGEKTVATLILGDSPGFRRTFARPAGESAVYDLEIASFDVGNRRDDWIGRDLLKVEREKIVEISARDWTLVKGEDGWQLKDFEGKPDQASVDRLLSRLGSLSYRSVLGQEDKPEYNQASPILALSFKLADGGARAYTLSQLKDSTDFVLKAADRPWYLKLSEYDLDGIEDLTRAKLAGEPETPPEAAPEASAQASPERPKGEQPSAEPTAAAEVEATAGPEATIEAATPPAEPDTSAGPQAPAEAEAPPPAPDAAPSAPAQPEAPEE